MQFLRELVGPSGAAPAPAAGHEGPPTASTSTGTPASPGPPSGGAQTAAARSPELLREENALLRSQLDALTLATAAAQKAEQERAAEAEYWKREATSVLLAPPPPAAASGAELEALRARAAALEGEVRELREAAAAAAERQRLGQAAHQEDRRLLAAEAAEATQRAAAAQAENERLGALSEELFRTVEALEAQLAAAAERLSLAQAQRGEDARAADAALQRAFGLPKDEAVRLSVGAADAAGRPGVLHVTSGHLCWELSGLLKLVSSEAAARLCIPIPQIQSLDRVPGLLGRGSALVVGLRDGTKHRFGGLLRRRELVQAVLAAAEAFRPIDIHCLRDGVDVREALQAVRAAAVPAGGLRLEALGPGQPLPPDARFTCYVHCPFLALYLHAATSGKTYGAGPKLPNALWEFAPAPPPAAPAAARRATQPTPPAAAPTPAPLASSASAASLPPPAPGAALSPCVTVRSAYNGRFLCAEPGLLLLPGRVVANRAAAGQWERWTLEYGAAPGLFSLRSAHGSLLSLAPDGALNLTKPGAAATSHETFSFSI